MDHHNYADSLKFVLVCLMWYICSASGNIIGKMVLNEFPYPVTVTMTQLFAISVYMIPILYFMKVPHTGDISKRYYLVMIFPLALGKFLASVSSHFSIWKVSVSYAHTVKATLPLFTVILTRVLLGEKQTKPVSKTAQQVYLSLAPIIGGVVIATLTEVSFDMMGLLSALMATMGFSLQSIFSKKCLKDTGIHHLRLLVLLSRIAAIFFLPLWLIFDVKNIVNSQAFPWLHRSRTPVANAMKRIVIIGASLVLLRNPVTTMNVVGMLVAICGALCYNKAKFDQNRARRKEKLLPYIHSESDLTAHLHQKGLPHSKSFANFQNRNGMVPHPEESHLFQNNVSLQSFDHFTILPPSQPPIPEWSSSKNRNSDVHSRAAHRIFEI
ncbi:hypothetical protein FSP39_013132 [Pinctada imbricata]|uniref:Sugar phosphate transporter domain-containing protein n=1 Tax=Pinctada imbricata TaxID=66713 RepID=A0AA89C1D2_PINIB|nr:hypothetical protein FSP39_013132 [Pinctada imbricata]